MAQPKDPAGPGDKSAMRIDPALVRELAELLTDNALTEIEVEDGDRRIKVKREAPAIVSAAAAPPFAIPAAAALTAPPMHAREDIGSEPSAEEESRCRSQATMVTAPSDRTAIWTADRKPLRESFIGTPG